MPPLRDQAILAQFRMILAEWRCTGYITWTDHAEEELRRCLSSWSSRAVNQLMHQFFEAGGVIKQVQEKRPEYSCYDYHYDFKLRIEGQLFYLETILLDDDPADPRIEVVNFHHA